MYLCKKYLLSCHLLGAEYTLDTEKLREQVQKYEKLYNLYRQVPGLS